MCKECCKGKHPPEFDRQTATFVGRVGANLPVGIPADMMQWVIDHGPIAASLNLGYADLGQLEPLLTDRIGLGPREFHGLEVPDNFVAQVLERAGWSDHEEEIDLVAGRLGRIGFIKPTRVVDIYARAELLGYSLLTYEVAAVIMGRPEIAGKTLFMGTPPIMCRDMKQRTLIFKNGRLKSRVIGYFSLISADEIIVFGKRRAQPEAVQN